MQVGGDCRDSLGPEQSRWVSMPLRSAQFKRNVRLSSLLPMPRPQQSRALRQREDTSAWSFPRAPDFRILVPTDPAEQGAEREQERDAREGDDGLHHKIATDHNEDHVRGE